MRIYLNSFCQISPRSDSKRRNSEQFLVSYIKRTEPVYLAWFGTVTIGYVDRVGDVDLIADSLRQQEEQQDK